MTDSPQITSPYPGLRPFEEHEERLFFGRGEQVVEMLTRLEDQRFLAVIGASGSGKSSLVRAGLLPQIRRGMLLGASPDWLIVKMRPGGDPFGNLAREFLAARAEADDAAAVSEAHVAVTEAVLRGSTAGLVHTLKDNGLAADTSVLLLVDQFEEIFRFRHRKKFESPRTNDSQIATADEAASFVNLLLATARQTQRPVYVVLTMRSDFLGDCDAFLGLPEAINESQFLTPRMNREQIRQAIERPLALPEFHAKTESGLTDLILNQIGTDPDQLPLMQHALMRTWRLSFDHFNVQATTGRDDSTPIQLRIRDFQTIGGIERALSKDAESAYEQLGQLKSESGQSLPWIARRLFCCLSDRGQEARLTRQLMTVREVAEIVARPEDLEPATPATATPAGVGVPLAPPVRDDSSTQTLPNESSPTNSNSRPPEDDSSTNNESTGKASGTTNQQTNKQTVKQSLLDDVLTVVRTFQDDGRSFIVHSPRGDLTPVSTLYISHEALIRQWNRASEWAAAEESAVETYRRLREDALRWNEDREPSDLLTSARLELALDWESAEQPTPGWAERLGGNLAVVLEFLRESQAEALRERRRRRNRMLTMGGALLLISALSAFAAYKAWEAESASAAANVARDVAKRNQTTAYIALADAAFEAVPPKEHEELFWRWRAVDEMLLADGRRDKVLERISLTSWMTPKPWLHHGLVTSVAFSPDSKTALTGSLDSTATLWNTQTGMPIAKPLRHRDTVRTVAFSGDGMSVVTGSDDKTARLWNAETGDPIGESMIHKDSVSAVAFSPDGKTLLTLSSGTARLWGTESGDPIAGRLNHPDSVVAVAFSPDGNSVLTGGFDNTARLWDAETGDPIAKEMIHSGSVTAVAFSPDGKSVLTGSNDNTARLWDAETGDPIAKKMTHSGSVIAVAFSPDGKSVLTGTESAARLWDAETGDSIAKPMIHPSEVIVGVAFNPNGKTVLTGSYETARLWDAETGQLIAQTMSPQDPILAVAFSPDGKTIAFDNVLGGDMMHFLVHHSSSQSFRHQNSVIAVAFSPDSKTVLTGSEDDKAKLWNAKTGEPIAKPMTHQDDVIAVAFSPDGKTVLTGSKDDKARLWNAQTGDLIAPPIAHHDDVETVAFSPDGKTVLTVSDDTARVWNAQTGAPIAKPMIHQDNGIIAGGSVFAGTFSPDGESVLTGTNDGTARIWNAQTGEPIAKPMSHRDSVFAVAFSPDGQSVLTGSRDDTARLWSAQTGKPIAKPLTHEDYVNAVAFSPDGQSVLTGSRDGTAIVWNAQTGNPIAKPMTHQSGVYAVAFSPDGKTVLTKSEKMARLWNAETGDPIAKPMSHQDYVRAIAFSPDGKSVLTAASFDNTARLWELPPPAVDPRIARDRLRISVEARTGLTRDDSDPRGFRELTPDEAFARYRQVQDEYDGKFGDLRSWDEYYAEHPEERPDSAGNGNTDAQSDADTKLTSANSASKSDSEVSSSSTIITALMLIVSMALVTVIVSVRHARAVSRE